MRCPQFQQRNTYQHPDVPDGGALPGGAYDQKEAFLILLNIDNLHFSYTGKPVLCGAALTVQKGELCALMGENGSGKSTLLKLAAGLLKQKEGTVHINGINIDTLGPKARARLVSYLPQRFGVAFDTDVTDVVLMGIHPALGAVQTPSKEHRKMALSALERLKIEPLADCNFLELSEGQKQMVMIARSIVQKAPLLLFDEPDSSLDINNRKHMMESLRRILGKEKGALMILHDQQLALTYCDKIYLTKDGIISGVIVKNGATPSSMQAELSKVFEGIRVFGIDGAFFIGY